MAEKTVKAKQSESDAQVEKLRQPEKPKAVQKVVKAADKDREKPKQPNAIARWRETIGELHKVSWPTTQETWRLTYIVLLVMLAMSITLGLLDFVFSKLITLLIA